MRFCEKRHEQVNSQTPHDYRIAPEVRGRVSSVLMLAYFGILPISFAVAGFLVAWSLKFMFLFEWTVIWTVETSTPLLHQEGRGF